MITHLEQAERYIAEGERQIARQREVVKLASDTDAHPEIRRL
jgi:hypothetical protein